MRTPKPQALSALVGAGLRTDGDGVLVHPRTLWDAGNAIYGRRENGLHSAGAGGFRFVIAWVREGVGGAMMMVGAIGPGVGVAVPGGEDWLGSALFWRGSLSR